MSSFSSKVRQSYEFRIHAMDTKTHNKYKKPNQNKKNKRFVYFMDATLTKTNLITIAGTLATVEVWICITNAMSNVHFSFALFLLTENLILLYFCKNHFQKYRFYFRFLCSVMNWKLSNRTTMKMNDSFGWQFASLCFVEVLSWFRFDLTYMFCFPLFKFISDSIKSNKIISFEFINLRINLAWKCSFPEKGNAYFHQVCDVSDYSPFFVGGWWNYCN